jgi:hypothetical protein
MTENSAFVLDIVIGCLVTWGSVFLLGSVGAADKYQLVAAMLGLGGTSFMVGVIGRHYERKGDDRGD